MSLSGVPKRVTELPVPAARENASVALDTLRSASDTQAKVAPPAAVKVNAAGPGAIRGVVPKGRATEAPGVVITVVGMLRVATDRPADIGDDAVPDGPRATVEMAVTATVLRVSAMTGGVPSA